AASGIRPLVLACSAVMLPIAAPGFLPSETVSDRAPAIVRADPAAAPRSGPPSDPRDVRVPRAPVAFATQISQFGITWTFDKEYPVGRFANDDWWVVGPVTIVGIDPPSTSGGRVTNGSMLDPDPRDSRQGYDSSTSNVT